MHNIMGINTGHNGSVAVVSDGELVYFVEEERLSRKKYDDAPLLSIIDACSKFHIDEIVVGGTHPEVPKFGWCGEDVYSSLVRRLQHQQDHVKTAYLGHDHHIGHAALGFYNSGFEQAIVIVVDGSGSYIKTETEEKVHIEGFEAESVYLLSYPNNVGLIHKSLGTNQGPAVRSGPFYTNSSVTVTKAYEAVTHYLGFHFIEAGKTMGLSSYGGRDPNIPPLFIHDRGSKDIFTPFYPAGSFVDTINIPYLQQTRDPRTWHQDFNFCSDAEKNLAWRIQQDTQQIIGNLIELCLKTVPDVNQVVLVGGYALNCVANYYYKKRFPDIKLYCEPISSDAGTSIGLAKLAWYSKENQENKTIHSLKSLYLGPDHNPSYLSTYLTSMVEQSKLVELEVSYSDVASLLQNKKIVAIFQGKSEAGPRALGNRSILYDPRDPEGKDKVNVVKKREWFRPFAGSVLKEYAQDWFDMAGMEESPFMMYAVNVISDKEQLIPAITHVDSTCRVQTVTKEQNHHFFSVIEEFFKLTGVPIILNTSFNLAGDPLVESIEQAVSTLIASELDYLYLPELKKIYRKYE